ncbi:MAG TPA: hypothetical protein PKD85_18885 [Saprospiraceae bacterium]|nr:hypothetical protein [Saprospiraceae bacterium]
MLLDQIISPLQQTKVSPSDKKTLIILQSDDYQSDLVQKTLSGIAKALGLSLEQDIELFLFERDQPTNLGSVMHNFEKVLIFGVNPRQIGLQIDAKIYKIYMFENFKLTIAHPLSTIANDIKTKQVLWKILQNMYGLA